MRARRTTVVLLAGLLVTGGGIATANWLLEGTGPGAAQGATVQPLTVLAGSPTAGLYPEPSGGYPTMTVPVGTVTALVSNPNPFPVRLTTAAVGSISTTPATGRTCPASNVVPAASSITLPTVTPIVVQAGAAAVAIQVPSAVKMVSGADNGCQGVLVSAMLTISGVPA